MNLGVGNEVGSIDTMLLLTMVVRHYNMALCYVDKVFPAHNKVNFPFIKFNIIFLLLLQTQTHLFDLIHLQ